MAILLNRKYGSRLECLYYILKSMYSKYGTNTKFKLKNFKFDEEDKYNVYNYCHLLVNVVGKDCCPFLNNPLNKSKCYATQSIISDTTKSKAVSDIAGSLEALGFIKRINNEYIITKNGENWVYSSFDSKEWLEIARQGVLSYGVVNGFLSIINDTKKTFNTKGLYLGYPHTEEKVHYEYDGKKYIVNLSTDSQTDSNTRTMSRILGWLISTGIIEPENDTNDKNELPQIYYRQLINRDRLNIRKFTKTKVYYDYVKNKNYIGNPLSYRRLHKDVRALRENGEEVLRNATMEYNQMILNRRFIIVYILNEYSKRNIGLNYSNFIKVLSAYSNYFFYDEKKIVNIMRTEMSIAPLAGIPFSICGEMIYPLSTINEKVLCEEVSKDLIKLCVEVINELGDFKL